MANEAVTFPDFTAELRKKMQQADISSFRQLSECSGVPRSQLLKLRRGECDRIPWGSFVAIAKSLQISIEEVLALFGLINTKPSAAPPENSDSFEAKAAEWQRESLEILESLILQLPTASFAAQNNPTAPAVRLLPLLKPLDQLLQSWQVEQIGTVGEQIAFDAQAHQWIGTGEMPETGSLVKVRYVGYQHGDRLLHRAKVGPI